MPIYKLTAEQADMIRLTWLETLKKVKHEYPNIDINNWRIVGVKAKTLRLPYPAEIARQYNVNLSTIYRILRLEQHILNPYRGAKEVRTQAIQLRQQGLRCKLIAERLGISVQRTKEITRGYGKSRTGDHHDRKDDPAVT